MKNTKILCSCIKCRTVKSVKGIHTHFLIAHTDYKEKHLKISRNAGGIGSHNQKKSRIVEYNKSPNHCAYCKTTLEYTHRGKKFCSSSCSAKFNNRLQSSDTKQKKSFTMSSKIVGSEVVGEFSPVKFISCKWCSKIFTKRDRKNYCSDHCRRLFRQDQVTHRSDDVKDKMKIGGLKGAASRGLRSKDEVSLYNLCYDEFQNVTHNTQIVAGWDADILLHDYKIAILWNGPWHYKQMPFSNHSLKQVQNRDKIKIKEFSNIGWKVLVYEDRNFTVAQAFADIKLEVATRVELVPDRI